MSLSIALPILKTPQGIILYQGVSPLNGEKIVVIAVGIAGSANPKTGASVIATYILPYEVNPLTAIFEGKDWIVCGDCKHRSTADDGMGTCYVKVHQAPLGIWRAWKNGSYEKPTLGMIQYFKNRIIRLGSYGDPAFVPYEVWETILKDSKGHLGYTHQWNNPKIDKRFQNICMASTDTVEETNKARSKGWRTFRVRQEDEPLMSREFICPASLEAGKRLTCEECLACHGGSFNRTENGTFKVGRGTVTIMAHGRNWKIKRFKEIMSRKNKETVKV